jgi:hypothetical protein
MEYQIDLLKKSKKYWFRIIWGIVVILVVIAWFADRIIENLGISTFDWVYQLLMVLFAAWLLVTGLGYHVRKLFGSAYIRIDDHLIAFKNGIWVKGESIPWKEIKSIKFKYNQFRITRVDGSASLLKLPYANSIVSNEAIHAVVKTAREKAIEIS